MLQRDFRLLVAESRMPSKAMAPIIMIALYTAWEGKLKETGLKYLNNYNHLAVFKI